LLFTSDTPHPVIFFFFAEVDGGVCSGGEIGVLTRGYFLKGTVVGGRQEM